MKHTDRRHRLAAASLGALALVQCGEPSRGFDASAQDGDGASTAATANAANPLSVSICGAWAEVALDTTAIDPRLDGAAHATATVRLHDDGIPGAGTTHPLRVTVLRAGAEVAVLNDAHDAAPGASVSFAWDGAIGGTPAAPGAYVVRVAYGCDAGTPSTRDAPLEVVRVGVTRVNVGDGDGQRLGLMWHKLAGTQGNYWMPDAARPLVVRGDGTTGALARADGSATPLPAVSTDTGSPPVSATGDPADADYDLPFALRVGTRPDVSVAFGRVAAAANSALRVRVEGATLAAGQSAVLADGAIATLRLDAAPAPAVGRYDIALRVHYEAAAPDGAFADIGTETVPLRLYGLLGPQTIDRARSDAPYAAWLVVADAVAGWVAGASSDPDAVASAVVHHVYADLGLHYDTAMGASFYTRYASGFGGASFDLAGFLDRQNGSTVNCSDCASIVSTYANMVGCDLGYNILTRNFPLYYIHAIGTPAFTNDPFHRGAPGGFNYHAVTDVVGGAHIFDATLTEDGDGDPSTSPFSETFADGVERAFYLGHLSPTTLTVTHDDKTTID